MTITSLLAAALRDPEVVAALREAIAPSGSEWIPLRRAAEDLGVRMEVLRDAARRGELTIGGAGRRRVVARTELDRWIASRAPSPRATRSGAHDMASIDRVIARLRRSA